MYLGELVEVAPTGTIFDEPAHPYTQSLLSAVPEIGGSETAQIRLEGQPPDPIDTPSGCRFHTGVRSPRRRVRRSSPSPRSSRPTTSIGVTSPIQIRGPARSANRRTRPRIGSRTPDRRCRMTEPAPSRNSHPLRPVLERGLERGLFDGAVVLVGSSAGVDAELCVGDRNTAGDPVTSETAFDVASLTKVVATTTITVRLVQETDALVDDERSRRRTPGNAAGRFRCTPY
ncbi:hypothetical protein D8S78_22155 [Natrialba swarupiae]|nr:hypothetical protein [Natrialba swarupiae]